MIDSIKVDLYGQFDDDTRHECTYPVKLANQYSFTEETVWAKSIVDPRGLHGKVCKPGTDCYVMWANQYGNYFSYITRNPRDSRGGMAMVTFFVNRNKVCDGRDILTSLRKLSDRLIVTGDYSYSGIEEDITDLRISRSTHVIPQRVVAKDVASTEPRIGFKEYNDVKNLEEIFTFIEQKEYSSYDKIIVVKREDVKENIMVPRISSELIRYYTVENAANAFGDPSYIVDSQIFKVTYKKENCDNKVVECHPPFANNKIFSVDGNVIILKTAEEVNVQFTKTFYFSIQKTNDGRGYDEDKISISVNGRIPDSRNRKFIQFTEAEIAASPVVLVSARGEHFKPYDVNVDLNQFVNNYSTIPIDMEPKIARVKVQFNFPDELSFGPVFMQFDESTEAYQDLIMKRRLCGYAAYPDINGVYHVNIPFNPKPVRDDNDRSLPKWAKALIISGVVLALAALVILIIMFGGDIIESIFSLIRNIGD